jgi:hypothetical protein
MGHTEMALAVAGLDQKRIEERVRQLAGGDWRAFPAAERAAYRFARKQARDPASVGAADIEPLIRLFGIERALDIIWWTCRCHYMTCVSDAFQLPLEEQNVFDGFLPGAGANKE